MSKAHFKVVYDGPALENHEMDINELAPALLAISDLVEEANYTIYGERSKAAVSVKGSFKTGCFGIDLVVAQDFLMGMRDFLLGETVDAALNLIGLIGGVAGAGGGLFALISWLKGRKITKVERLEGDRRRIYVGTEYLDTELQVIELYRNIKLRTAIEKAVVRPLEKSGVDSFAFHDCQSDEPLFSVDKAGAHWFRAPVQEDEPINDVEMTASLQLVSNFISAG